MKPFQAAFKFVLDHETDRANPTGYEHYPNDPGGETKYGISKRSYPNVDIKHLGLSEAMVIYARDYWGANKLDEKPFPYSIALFDTAVNMGAGRMREFDTQAKGDLRLFLELRRTHYLDLVKEKPTLKEFLQGWLNRVNDLSKYCYIQEEELQNQDVKQSSQVLVPTQPPEQTP